MLCGRAVLSFSSGGRAGWPPEFDMAQQQETKHGDSTVLEQETLQTKPPPMYQVVLLNDDYTPMEFVVIILQKFFGKGLEQATQIMLKVHREGKGACGVYPRDVAHTKVENVRDFSRKHQQPLQCMMEEV
jgi:ATP-dependent Clp protease adaptor protein ClpS